MNKYNLRDIKRIYRRVKSIKREINVASETKILSKTLEETLDAYSPLHQGTIGFVTKT